MLSKRLFLSAIAIASVCLLGSGAAADQPYPNRPVRIIVAGVPGTPFDLIARAVAGKLATSLKQTFLVETRPGAAGNLGAEFVAKAAADGYTLLIALGTTFTVNPSLYKKLPYDPERDLRPITITAKASTMLVVHPSIPVYSVPEFVALAKQEPVSYAHGGHGSPGHLSPDVPTMSEAGYPNFKVETYYVISAPAGTPESIVALLEHEIRLALKSSDLQETFRPQDIEILATTGAEAKARLKSDAELWAKVVNAAGMHVD